jgi:hypothetical protein
MKTYAPSATKRLAVAKPMPVEPPVMTATFPLRLVITFSLNAAISVTAFAATNGLNGTDQRGALSRPRF